VDRQTILIADDERGIRNLLRSYCERQGYAVRIAASGQEALAALDDERFDVAIVDLHMPGATGLDVLAHAREAQPECEVIILTGFADLDSAVEALRLGAYDYMQKPVSDLHHLGVVISRALERRALSQHNAALVRDLQAANTEIERRRRQELDYIQQIGQAMASALDAREIVQVLVQAVYNSIRCDVSAALLLHENGGKPWALAVAKQRLTQEEEQTLVEALIDRLPEESRPDLAEVRLHVAVAEPLPGGIQPPPAPDAPSEAPARAEIPIWGSLEHGFLAAHDQVDGVIAFAQRVPLYYEDQELAMFGILVSQGSVALENSRLFARTHELAVRDGLTGLYNHRYFFQALAEEIGRARLRDQVTAVIMVDLDGGQRGGLKAVNDALGHLAGDELLREVGRAIAGIVRRGDLVARYGGDEYAVMAPRTNADQALTLANRIAEELRRRVFSIQGVEVAVTASIGAAVSDPADEDASAVVSRADDGLYRAKARGGDRVCFVAAEEGQDGQDSQD